MEKHEMIFPVGSYRGIPYFLPPADFDETGALKRLESARNALQEDLRKFPEGYLRTSEQISASFIYAHPPDYYGKPMLNASVEEWREVFCRFRSMHIDTVIFQAALWKELGQCFYQTRCFSDMNSFPVVERMLEAAEKENIHVFLGGYGSTAGWKEHFTPEELDREIECYRLCFGELFQLGKFDGLYFPAETAFKGKRQQEKEQRMHFLYQHFAQIVKEKKADLKIIVSPATTHNPSDNEAFKDFWNTVLENTNIDILMPQDCIGNNCSRLPFLDSQWKAWKEVADQQQLVLWSNNEIFERRGYRPDHNIFPASPKRVAAQLALTAPYVSRHCCWEALYLTSDEASSEGIRLRRFMETGVF